MILLHSPTCHAYRTLGHPEKPARVERTVDLLRSQKLLPISWIEPDLATDAQIRRAHTAECLARLAVPSDFDGDTAWHPGIEQHARASAGAALKAMDLAAAGSPAFSLMRPPGHHATRTQSMGFCYLGSISIAALEAQSRGRRVALFDFDVHHGNGTEDIVAGVEGITFASVHQSPCYPGTGLTDVSHNCFNYPVAPGLSRPLWRDALQRALDRLQQSKPDILGVSAGFDAYVKDPLANGSLEMEDFHWLGQQLRRTGLPVFSVLEGGYSLDLPELVLSYLQGLVA